MPQLGSRSAGFALSLAIFMLYYFLYAAGEDFGRSGTAPVALMAWMPNFVFGILGLYLLNLASTERAPLPLIWFAETKHYIYEKINPQSQK